MATRLPAYSPALITGDPAALLLLRTFGLPRPRDESFALRERSPSPDLNEAEEFAAVLALTSQRVRDAITELRAEEVVRLVSADGPGVYVGR